MKINEALYNDTNHYLIIAARAQIMRRPAFAGNCLCWYLGNQSQVNQLRGEASLKSILARCN